MTILPGEHSECLLPYVRCALQHMLAGAVAGTLEHTLMFPIDTIKTRMQALSHPGQRVYTSTLPTTLVDDKRIDICIEAPNAILVCHFLPIWPLLCKYLAIARSPEHVSAAVPAACARP